MEQADSSAERHFQTHRKPLKQAGMAQETGRSGASVIIRVALKENVYQKRVLYFISGHCPLTCLQIRDLLELEFLHRSASPDGFVELNTFNK